MPSAFAELLSGDPNSGSAARATHPGPELHSARSSVTARIEGSRGTAHPSVAAPKSTVHPGTGWISWSVWRPVLLGAGLAFLIAIVPLAIALSGDGTGTRQASVQNLSTEAGQASAAGDWRRCIGLYTDVIQQASSDLTAVRGRAACEASHGDIGAAQSDLSHAISLDSTDPATFLARGHVNDELGSFSAAASDYEHVSQMPEASPDDAASAVEGLRTLHLDRDAIAAASAAIRRFPNAWQAHDELALTYNDLGDLPDANGQFQQALNLTSDLGRAKVLTDRAALRKATGDVNGALTDANQAVALDPRWEYLRARAEIRQALGDLSGADTDLTRALDIEQRGWWPDATKVRIWLLDERGKLRLELGDRADARSDFTAALAITPPSDVASRNVLQLELRQAQG